MNGKRSVIVFSILCAICSCTSEPEVFVIRTGLAEQVSADGVKFVGNVEGLGKKKITSMGFVWSTFSTPSLSNSQDDRWQAGAPAAGNFETLVTVGLKPNVDYWFRVYAAESSTLYYSAPVKFRSLGCKGPEINSFTPTSLPWTAGGSVVLQGNFSPRLSLNTVTLVSVNSPSLIYQCTEMETDGKTLRLTISPFTYAGDYRFSVLINGQTGVSSQIFTLN